MVAVADRADTSMSGMVGIHIRNCLPAFRAAVLDMIGGILLVEYAHLKNTDFDATVAIPTICFESVVVQCGFCRST